MKRTLAAIALIGYSAVCFAIDDSQEPPLKFTLEINGQQHELELNKPVTLDGAYNDPKIVLRASPIRQFTYGDVAFQYPASFLWEAEIESDKEKSWTLSGMYFKIMYLVLPDALSVEEYSQAVAEQLGEEDARICDTERTLGGQKHKGKLLHLEDGPVNYEAYALPAKSGSRLLVLLDCPPDDRAISKEAEGALKLLSSSFKDTAASNKPEADDGK